MNPGDLFMADFVSAGRHPVIVVSREDLNQGRYVLVAVRTSARISVRRTFPNCVPFLAGGFGLTADRVAQCENIVSIEKSDIIDLDDGLMGTLDAMRMRDVIKAISYVIDSDCEPI